MDGGMERGSAAWASDGVWMELGGGLSVQTGGLPWKSQKKESSGTYIPVGKQ